jgi:hypothetical protein
MAKLRLDGQGITLCANIAPYYNVVRPTGGPTWQLRARLCCSPRGKRSAKGQSGHFDRAPLTSGLPQLTDILTVIGMSQKVPIPEVARLFDHLVSACEQRGWDVDAVVSGEPYSRLAPG